MSVSGMKRLSVFAFRTDSDKILRRLMRLRCVEVRSVDLSDDALALKRSQSEDRLAEAERELASIRAVLPVLTKYSTRKTGLGRTVHEFDSDLFFKDGSAERARAAVARTVEFQERLKEIAGEQSRLRSLAVACEPWMDYNAPIGETKTRWTRTLLGSCALGKDTEESAGTRLNEAGAYVEFISSDGGSLYLAVTYHVDSETDVQRALASVGFVAADLSEITQSAEKTAQQCERDLERLDGETVQIEEAMRDLAERLDLVEILHDVVDTDRTVALLYRRMADTDACSLIEGWIPDFTADAVEEALKNFECAYEIEEPAEGEEPPVLLRNNAFAKNFEWVVGMYSYPKYGKFDPTYIMSIFYFVIFGLMFADVGYGLLLILGCFGGIKLLNPRPGMRRMLSMFGYCGISCVIMGVIFGGWFGDLPTAIMTNLLHLPVDTGAGHFFSSGLWFNPLDDPMTFLIFSLAVGAIHMITGMAINFYDLCKKGRAPEAFCTILPYWVLFAGLALLLLDTKIALAVSAVGVLMILLLKGYGQKNFFARIVKGLGGLYGLISYASDLLSYSRILALGLVAGVIAKVINLITMMGDGNPIGFIIMLIVLILGHLLNIAINLLGTFIHASRLQYLEFFGKFFEDGGVPFDPTLPTETYSEEISD